MSRVNRDTLAALQDNIDNIRNFCILAHVDHGKTTLSDSLVGSNGLFSKRLVGRIRYLDSTDEEQQRGITMQSSAISLMYKQETRQNISITDQACANSSPKKGTVAEGEGRVPAPTEILEQKYLINLVDCPGHIDFSSDVSTATRLCDGALVVVDVLEGVCTQTRAVVNKALKERMSPVLCLNKIDRLLLDWQYSCTEAFNHIRNILTELNAFAYSTQTQLQPPPAQPALWNFAPEKGNVLFTSAIDGWGFTTAKIANMWANKLGVNTKVLQKYLFEDYYFNPKTKKLAKCEVGVTAQKPLFASMALEPIWSIYTTCLTENNVTKASKMAMRALGVQLTEREINARDARGTLMTIMTRWLPLADATLRAVVRCMPSPKVAQKERFDTLMPAIPSLPTNISNDGTNNFDDNNSDGRDCPVLLFISKMMPYPISSLCDIVADDAANGNDDDDGEVFVALARVFSGKVSRTDDQNGPQLYILNPRHNANLSISGVTAVSCADLGLYLCLGPSIASVDEVTAGNIVGIYGLEDQIMKTGSLCSTWQAQPLRPMTFQSQPMVKVAIEPKMHSDLQNVDRGLKALHQYDPVVEVEIDETGQYVLSCLGEIHLEHCLKLLSEKFAKCDISASAPLVPVRETILEPFLALATEEAQMASAKNGRHTLYDSFKGVHDMHVSDSGSNSDSDSDSDDDGDSSTNFALLDVLRNDTKKRILATGPRGQDTNILVLSADACVYKNIQNNVWKIYYHSHRVLFLKAFQRLLHSITAGFQLATAAGPLCKEPLHGVCFCIENISISASALQSLTGVSVNELISELPDPVPEESDLEDVTSNWHQLSSGALISQVAESMHLAMLSCPLRLVEPVYQCTLQCETSQIGNLYSVLSKRRGVVVEEDVIDGTSIFLLKAFLPVVESFGFAAELLKKSSGEATTPQMQMSHWQIRDLDPFWKPTSEEELDVYGNDSVFETNNNSARAFIDNIRKRKGLPIEEKIVNFAEKQRTLNKKK
eukprot:GSChrysophyteH1.ASY1.ANO1.20.1 assembled CDS